MKGGGGDCNPQPPPPPPPPPRIRLWFAFKDLMRLMRFIRLGALEKICTGPGLALGGPDGISHISFLHEAAAHIIQQVNKNLIEKVGGI